MIKRYMGWIMTGLLVALFFIGQARAQTRLYWENGQVVGSASQANINSWYRDLPVYNSARSIPPASVSVSGGMATMERAAFMEVGVGSGLGQAVKIAVRDVVTSPVSSLGKGLVTVARASPAGIVGTVAGSMLLDAGIRYVNGRWMKDGQAEQAPNGYPYLQSYGYFTDNTTGAFLGSGEVADKTGDTQKICAGLFPTKGVAWYATGSYNDGGLLTCINRDSSLMGQARRVKPGCAPGHSNDSGTCYPPGYQPAQDSAPATDAQIEGAMTSQMTLHPDKAMDVLKNIYDNGGWVPLDVADSAGWTLPTTPVKGTPSTTSTNSTAPNGDSLTTTKTTTPTLNLSTSGNTAGTNTVNYTVTNNTTTTVTNNTTGETSTSTGTEDPPITFQDSAMPELPKLYTQKYPDGIAGVWRDSHPDVQNTAFFQGVKSMFPSFGAGQCPLWRMTFNLGKPGNFGTGDLTVPCWIFQALGLVILATATFTARKIIF